MMAARAIEARAEWPETGPREQRTLVLISANTRPRAQSYNGTARSDSRPLIWSASYKLLTTLSAVFHGLFADMVDGPPISTTQVPAEPTDSGERVRWRTNSN